MFFPGGVAGGDGEEVVEEVAGGGVFVEAADEVGDGGVEVMAVDDGGVEEEVFCFFQNGTGLGGGHAFQHFELDVGFDFVFLA